MKRSIREVCLQATGGCRQASRFLQRRAWWEVSGGPGRARGNGELRRWRASFREAQLVGGGVGAPHKPWEGGQEAVEGRDEGIGNQGPV